MPHIHTKPGEHDHTASAFIIRTDFEEPKVMLHMHKILKKYLQFGGHIETTENPWEAITHELLEESGYELSQLKLLQPKQRMESPPDVTLHPMPIYHITHQFNETHLHTDGAYAFMTGEPPKHRISDDESGNPSYLQDQSYWNCQPIRPWNQSVKRLYLFLTFACFNGKKLIRQSSINCPEYTILSRQLAA